MPSQRARSLSGRLTANPFATSASSPDLTTLPTQEDELNQTNNEASTDGSVVIPIHSSSNLHPPSSSPSPAHPWINRVVQPVTSTFRQVFSSSNPTNLHSDQQPSFQNVGDDPNQSQFEQQQLPQQEQEQQLQQHEQQEQQQQEQQEQQNQIQFDQRKQFAENGNEVSLTRRNALMKFLERGADDHFVLKELTKKEVFEHVRKLAAPNINSTRDLRASQIYRNSQTFQCSGKKRNLEKGLRNNTSKSSSKQRGHSTLSSSSSSQLISDNMKSKLKKGKNHHQQQQSNTNRKIYNNQYKHLFDSINEQQQTISINGNRLQLRDMRQVDPKFSSTPAILVREEAILVKLEYIRAIILSDRLLIFDPDNEMVRKAIWNIEKTLSHDTESYFNPFEFKVLEGILIHICLVLESDFSLIEPELRNSFQTLPENISNASLEALSHLEYRLKYYVIRAKNVQHAIQTILDDDDDMADMYLSEKRKNPGTVRNPLDHNDVEMLLETHLQIVDDISSRASLLQQGIDDTENLIEMRLDTVQNRVLMFNLIFNTLSTGGSLGTLITALFGMNVKLPGSGDNSSNENQRSSFIIVCIATILVIFFFIFITLEWCRKKGLFSRKLYDPSTETSDEEKKPEGKKMEELIDSDHCDSSEAGRSTGIGLNRFNNPLVKRRKRRLQNKMRLDDDKYTSGGSGSVPDDGDVSITESEMLDKEHLI